VSGEPIDLDGWEHERRTALDGLVSALGADTTEIDADPLSFLPTLDAFVAEQDYGSFDQEDWLWLHTALAAYLAQVFITQHGAHWTATTDERGTNYMLIARGWDGDEHTVSPMDVVYDDLQNTPPVVMRMLATAERTLGVVPDPQ
jgi:Domain of unknown function (DUF3806)